MPTLKKSGPASTELPSMVPALEELEETALWRVSKSSRLLSGCAEGARPVFMAVAGVCSVWWCHGNVVTRLGLEVAEGLSAPHLCGVAERHWMSSHVCIANRPCNRSKEK